jgi:hypothetical protein
MAPLIDATHFRDRARKFRPLAGMLNDPAFGISMEAIKAFAKAILTGALKQMAGTGTECARRSNRPRRCVGSVRRLVHSRPEHSLPPYPPLRAFS